MSRSQRARGLAPTITLALMIHASETHAQAFVDVESNREIPLGAVLGGLLVLVCGLLLARWMLSGDRRRARLLEDTRYQTAVAQYYGNSEVAQPERLATAIAGLTEQGVSERRARRNLEFLCGITQARR